MSRKRLIIRCGERWDNAPIGARMVAVAEPYLVVSLMP